MKKIVISLLLALILCFSFGCGKNNNDAEQSVLLPPTEDLIYEPTTPENGGGTETDTDTNKDKPAEEQYYIVNGLNTGDTELVVIPETHEGKTVIGIGDNAFKDNTKIKEIVIPSSVTTIGNNAFSGCTNLTAVYYKGLNGGWQKITIGAGNDILSSGIIYFYSENEPTNTDYRFWYIKNNQPVVWEATNSNGEYTPYY